MPDKPSQSQDRTEDRYSIMALGPHGLVRAQHIELGRDADTGGQTAYMVDEVRGLIRHSRIERVDLMTRLIEDKRVSPDYAVPEETIEAEARIVRLRFGPRRYLHKENLWPYLDNMVDQLVRYVSSRRRGPDIIHGHYADAGYVGSRLARILGVPFVFTGHSLGRVKRARLIDEGGDPDVLERRYHLTQRIEAEEQALETAGVVIASTSQEIREQYELYDHYVPKRMEVIPPGVDLSLFHPPGPDWDEGPIRQSLEPFLRDPGKPVILAVARADERKNFPTLIRAYAETPGLRERANLVIVAGTRRTLDEMEAGARRVLMQILSLIDRYDLYGVAAYPRQLTPENVPDLYRFVRASRGVFVNPALTEPFGLTLIEAAATGIPVIATSDGGPRDILAACRNGELVDPLDAEGMGARLRSALESPERWERWSENGLKNVGRFSWSAHAEQYVHVVEGLLKGRRTAAVTLGPRSRLPGADRMLVVDLDDTLTGDQEALESLIGSLKRTGDRVAFVVVTGRSLEAALPFLRELSGRYPDVVVTDSGAEIRYGWPNIEPDESWMKHIDHDWKPASVRELVGRLGGVSLKEAAAEPARFRISCVLRPGKAPRPEAIRRHLRKNGLHVTVILDRETELEILPIRASPGLALRFLGLKLSIPHGRMLVAGDSGNDEDMLSGDTLGVVVGNYKKELEHLRQHSRVYFAPGRHARGVLEGIDYYDFLGHIRIPQEEPGA